MELLRIVSMFLIMLHHASYHGYGMRGGLVTDLFVFGGGVGVNCFVFITGYYMVQSHMTLAKVLKIWISVLMYSCGICFLVYAFMPSGGDVSPAHMQKFLLPISNGCYWFVTAYIILMLFSPFLNRFLLSLDKRALLAFGMALLFLLVFLPIPFRHWRGAILDFVMIYSLAAYVRLYGERLLSVPSWKWFSMAGLSFLFIMAGVALKAQMSPEQLLSYKSTLAWLALSKGSILTVLMSLFLSIGFATCRIGEIRFVNLVAVCAFGVYLIHEHPMLRPMIWNGVFHVSERPDTLELAWYCITSSVVVYAACTLIEMLRLQTLGRLYDWMAKRFLLRWAYGVWGGIRRLFERLARIC